MTINLHGKEYVEVKDRVTAAHLEDSYSMLSEETFELGGRSYCRVFIDVKGKQYIGTAEIKFNAKPNTPDGQSPFECGETSALGRALGFAGYGVVDSIASADEVASNQQQAEPPKGRFVPPPRQPKVVEEHISIGNLYERGKPQRWTTGEEFYQYLSEKFGKLITRENVKTLTQADLAEVSKQMDSLMPASVPGAN